MNNVPFSNSVLSVCGKTKFWHSQIILAIPQLKKPPWN